MHPLTIVLLAAGAVVAALVAEAFLLRAFYSRRAREAGLEAEKILADARHEAAENLRIAEEAAARKTEEEAGALDRELQARQRSLEEKEQKLSRRERNLDRRHSLLDQEEKELQARRRTLDSEQSRLRDREAEAEHLVGERRRALERIAAMSFEGARRVLLEEASREARAEAGMLRERIVQSARDSARDEARRILSTTIRRIAVGEVVESTVTVVPLPDEEMKGRIIGREGRNIRAIELATGVDLLIDDTPQAILLSSFDPVRRAVAKIALERLIADGRIHPARIEDVVQRVASEIDGVIAEEGERAAYEVGVTNLHPRVIKLLGRLKLSLDHGQNLLAHSLETARIAGMIAAEIGAREDVARRAGLLHEIGRAPEGPAEGHPAQAAADLLQKLGEPEQVVRAVGEQEEIEKATLLESLLVHTAHRMSVARPGSRDHLLQVFFERLRKIEDVALSFAGVTRAHAVKAGKELMVFVAADKLADAEAIALSRSVARRLEKEADYPGEIRVQVIRETRSVDYAL